MTKNLTNVSKNCKAHWSLLRRLLNNKKIPLIPPLYHENNLWRTLKKYRSFLIPILQHSLISNSSKLPSHFQYLNCNRLSCVNFSHDKIAKVIQNQDPNKAHGQNNICIRMLKVLGPSTYKPLEIIFNQCLGTGVLPPEWKKVTSFLFTKNGTNRHWKTTVQCRCYLFEGKFLKH